MIQAGIFNELKNDPALASLLDDGSGGFNIFPTVVPEPRLENTNYEAFITYFKIAENRDRTCNFVVHTFQINAIARTYNSVQDLADDIIRVLQCFVGDMGGQELVDRSYEINRVDQYNDDNQLYFVPIDFKFITKFS